MVFFAHQRSLFFPLCDLDCHFDYFFGEVENGVTDCYRDVTRAKGNPLIQYRVLCKVKALKANQLRYSYDGRDLLDGRRQACHEREIQLMSDNVGLLQ